MSDYPTNLKYNKSHTWILVEKNIATLGAIQSSIDNAQDVVMIKLPELNQEFNIGDIYTSIESVKWSGHLLSPVKGKVVEVNEKLDDNPELLNEDSYKNWIIKIEFDEIDKELMDSKQAKKEYEE